MKLAIAAAVALAATVGAMILPPDAAAQATISANALVGRPLVNSYGETLGQVQTVLVDDSNIVRHVIVLAGDGLGTTRRVAIEPTRITPMGDRFLLNATRDDLRLLPSYDYAAPTGIVFIDRGRQVPEFGPVVAKPIFTIEEARARIEAHGYRAVTNLQQDDQLTWWANATAADGRMVRVALDANGTVAMR